jgi:hypothetical protein
LFIAYLSSDYNSIPVIIKFDISVSTLIGLSGLKWISIKARIKNIFNNLNVIFSFLLNSKESIFLSLILFLSIEINGAAIRKLLEATGACSAKMRGATLRICGLANLLRIAWDLRAGPQEYGAARFGEVWSPRRSSRPIPQYSIVYGGPPIYIEKKNFFSEGHFSIDVIRWYNYYYNCILYENLLLRSHFLIDKTLQP